MVQSPLNYTGGKFKLLSQILPLFPQDIETFVDLFCGGCNVGLNVNSKKVIYNDKNEYVISLFKTMKETEKQVFLDAVEQMIDIYGLSRTSEYGYSYYNVTPNPTGVSGYNKEKFNKLRNDYNIGKFQSAFEKSVAFYTLIVFAFNYQIRFNSKNEYNMPVGKRDFNNAMRLKLLDFIDRIQEQDCEFFCQDYKLFDIKILSRHDLVYVDPPYLISCATYNQDWTEESEQELLDFLDKLSDKNIRFALSNVLCSKGVENKILINWLDKNKTRYFVNYLNKDYSNSNYHKKDRVSKNEEVLILNYK